MLYLVNDTAVSLNKKSANASSAGGSSSYIAGLINFLINKKIDFGLIGNYDNKSEIHQVIYPLLFNSNTKFILGLIKVFIREHFQSKDILYFQRPDHLAISMFLHCKRVLHLHGQSRTTIIANRGRLTITTYLFLERIAMRLADKVIITDKLTYDLYIKSYPSIIKKVYIIPTGIDLSFFTRKSLLEKYKIVNEEKILVFIGRLAYPKRIFDMIDAFELVYKTKSNCKFYIAGIGPMLTAIKKYIINNGLQDRVILKGLLLKSDVRDLIYSCNAAILLSYNEGSPISIKEILACGKPVIVNEVGDLKDYVMNDKTGYLVDANNNQEVALAIIKAFENSAKMTDACSDVMQHYDALKINNRITQIITNLQNAV